MTNRFERVINRCRWPIYALLSIALSVGWERALAADPVSLSHAPQWNALDFRTVVIDNRSGDVKMVGDVNGDGLVDLVIGGDATEGLTWYSAPDWRPYLIGLPMVEFTTDAALGDIDNDGDLDIVTPDGPGGNNLVLFKNPLPTGDPTDGAQWRRREVGAIGDWGKDVELADFDGDGRIDIAARSQSSVMIFFQNADSTWMQRVLDEPNVGQEGLASGDIDNDGNQDLVVRGAWLENPGGSKARTEKWRRYSIGRTPASFKALVADVDQDGQPDVLYSSSEGIADVVRYTAVNRNPRGPWRRQEILPRVEKAHTLAAGDLDRDGDVDLVVAQMHTSRDGLIAIVYNIDGRGEVWRVQVVGNSGVHNAVLADLDADGDLDLYGSNWVTNPPLRVWTNTLDRRRQGLRQDRWTLVKSLTVEQPSCALSFDDLDGNGLPDVTCGAQSWHNPGGDLSGIWLRTANAFGTGPVTGELVPLSAELPPSLSSEFVLLSIADFNRDNVRDFLVSGLTASKGLFILADHGGGRRGLQRVNPSHYRSARAVDLDADGDPDIIGVMGAATHSIHILRNDAR